MAYTLKNDDDDDDDDDEESHVQRNTWKIILQI
jgi:hypothetical protein